MEIYYDIIMEYKSHYDDCEHNCDKMLYAI